MDKNVQVAILEVMKEVGVVSTTKSEGLTYRYLSERKLIESVRPAMLRQGLIMYPVSAKVEQVHTPNSKGNILSYSITHSTYRFYHVESGTFIDVESVGEGVDGTGDKATGKALTAAFKYALRHTFMLETSDEDRKRKMSSDENSENEDGETTLDKIKAFYNENTELRAALKEINARFVAEHLGGNGNVAKIKDEEILKNILNEYEKLKG